MQCKVKSVALVAACGCILHSLKSKCDTSVGFPIASFCYGFLYYQLMLLLFPAFHCYMPIQHRLCCFLLFRSTSSSSITWFISIFADAAKETHERIELSMQIKKAKEITWQVARAIMILLWFNAPNRMLMYLFAVVDFEIL